MTRDALLDQLVQENLPAEVRRAALDALRCQLRTTEDARQQQALRMLLLRAARIAMTSGGSSAVTGDLTALAMEDASWLITPSALEASSPLNTPIRVSVQDGPPVDASIEAQLQQMSLPNSPDLEAKYRFTAINVKRDALAVVLAPTTWTSAKRFHAAVQRDPAWASKLPDGRWATPVPFGDQLLPGIAVVHAIIVTSDQQVIAAQRSSDVSYSPLHWSVSFEEQLSEKDFSHNHDAFTAAAQRGLHEEFGGEIPAENIVPLATVMQMDLLNLGIIMLLRPPMTTEEVRDSWQSVATDGWEATQVRGLPLDTLNSGLTNLRPLHPSSELRWLALRRRLFAK
jgi:hypothetical protein